MPTVSPNTLPTLSKDSKEASKMVIVKDKVSEFEKSNSYQFSLPDGYIVSELAPTGTDFLLGVSQVQCIHKTTTISKEELCDVSIFSEPNKVLNGTLEEDIKSVGESIVEFKKVNFSGNVGFEVLFKLSTFKGYKIVFIRDNRVYSITTPLNLDAKNIDEAKSMLSETQKMVLETFVIK